MTCVYQWLTSEEAHSDMARFGDLTPAIQAQRVKRRVRVVSPDQDSSPIDEGVHQLSLNAVEGKMKTFSRGELWGTFGPQTHHDLTKFIGSVAKLKAEKGISDEKAVQ